MRRLELYIRIPGLLGPVPEEAAGLVEETPHLRDLARLLSRSRRNVNHSGAETVIPGFDRTSGGSDALPAGPLGLLGEGRPPGDAYWFRADPVHFFPDRDRLLMQGPTALGITDEEADALAETFNSFFSSDGLELVVGQSADRWYLRCQSVPDVQTIAIADALATSVDQSLPGGSDSSAWRAKLNEVQMLFHGHAINEQRQSKGQPVINGIWPWGGGVLPSVTSAWSSVYSNEPIVRGLASCAGVAAEELPENPADSLSSLGSGRILIALDELPAVTDAESFQCWESRVRDFAQRWADPLRGALAQRLSVLTIDSGGIRWTATSSSRWALWRRNMPFHRLLNRL